MTQTWTIYWLNPEDGKGWEVWEAGVSRARAMAYRIVFGAVIKKEERKIEVR